MFQSLYIIERDKDFELLIMGKEDFVQNDFLLIRKMKQGDDDALDLFVHKYYQDILNYSESEMARVDKALAISVSLNILKGTN